MNDEIAALLGEAQTPPPAPPKKISKVPLTPMPGDDTAGLSSRDKMQKWVLGWLARNKGRTGPGVIKAGSTAPGSAIVLQTTTRQAEVSLQRGPKGVEGLEYRCPCGRTEKFLVE
jgi:hypothetical protein